MNRYKVISSTTVYEYTYVEASNIQEAREIAEGYTSVEPEWKEFGAGDFTIQEVEEITQ